MTAPSTLIQHLKQVLNPTLTRDRSVLVEDNPGSKSGETKLTNLGNGVILQLASSAPGPQNALLFPLHNSQQEGLTKLCDYAIFAPRDKDTRLVILLCELKSRSLNKHLQQLQGGLLLIEYVLNTVLLHHPPCQQPELIEYRGITFSTQGPSPRGSSKPSQSPDFNQDPETGLPFILAQSGREYHINTFSGTIPKDKRRLHHHYRGMP